MYAQSKRLTEPVLPQYSSSSSIPIDCGLVGEDGCIWSKDVHDVSKSQSQICKVIRTSCEMYSSMVAKSVIAHDQGSNKESSIPSSSPSITPCPEATSLAVLSVNDEVSESMKTAVQGEEEEGCSGGEECSRVYFVHDNSWNEEFKVEFSRRRFGCGCGCGQFQENGYPCVHALFVLHQKNMLDEDLQ